MANLSSYGSDVLSEVPHYENTHNDMLNQSVQEMSYSEQTHLVNYPKNEITSDSNIIPYSQYLLETQNAAFQDTNFSAQQDAMILSVFEQLSNQVTNCNKINKDNLIANEPLSVEVERYKERRNIQGVSGALDGAVNISGPSGELDGTPTLSDGTVFLKLKRRVYAMAVRDFKKRGRFVRQPTNDKKTFQKIRDDKNGKSDRKCLRCGDPNQLIRECPKPPKDKNQRAFVRGSWSDSGKEDNEKVKDKTCLMAHASSKMCLGINLEPDEWIKDSGCSKHMTGN
ncbi:hypothetical protein Tco_1248825 [Tanacetum coccineum]